MLSSVKRFDLKTDWSCCLLQHYSGLEEAVFRNIRACKELSQTTRTAYGPNGKNLPRTVNHFYF